MAASKSARMALSWTEKYRPRDLDELVGHIKPVQEMRAWARSWTDGRPPERKALILEGEPGVGKTTAALALAAEMGWDVIELNASDSRNMESIRMLATRGALSRDITDMAGYAGLESYRLKMVLLDEADNLFERSVSSEDGSEVGDRGGKKAILELVKMTKQPVVLIVNDLYGLTSGPGAALNQSCQKVRFRKVSIASIAKRLRFICAQESMVYDDSVIESISERAEGDLRSAISDLQLMCAGRSRIGIKDSDVLGTRDTRDNIFEVLDKVFRAGSFKASRAALTEVDEDVESLMLWVSENVDVAMSHPEDIERATSLLSRSDLFLGRVRRRQNYGLWAYAKDLMAALATARKHPHRSEGRYRFPSYLRSMSRTKEARGALREAALLLGRTLHTSSRTVMEDPFWRLGLLCERDHEFASHLAAAVQLESQHMKLLTGGRLKGQDLDVIMEGARALAYDQVRPRGIEHDRFLEEGEVEEVDDGTVAEKEGADGKDQEKGPRQSGLFDFR